ncbi:MAG: DUF4912 domain-containing protein [bacterium]|nr:DUF4912 domain-containing protein [bacterium]
MVLTQVLGAARSALDTVESCGAAVGRFVRDRLEPLLGGLVGRMLGGPWSALRRSTPPPADAARDRVEESKFWLGPAVRGEPAVGPSSGEHGELPRAYGRDRCVLLPRDPWWLFAFWEVTPTTRVAALRALAAEAEGAVEVLRVFERPLGGAERLAFDVELTPGADRWYVPLGRPGGAWVVELGLRTARGRFVPLVRSNPAVAPAAAASEQTEVEWVTVRAQGGPDPAATAWSGQRVAEPDVRSLLDAGKSRSSEAVPAR